MTSTTKNHRRHTAHHSGNNSMRDFRRQAADIGDAVRSMASTAGKAAEKSLNPLENHIREKPLKSLAIAAGVGLFVGLFILRR